VIVRGAGAAGEVGRLVELAHHRGWTVQIIVTPAALAFIDAPKLEAQTGRPVRSGYRGPGEPRSPRADAIIVAPATHNTINKWANGISDTYALGILAEAPAFGIPLVRSSAEAGEFGRCLGVVTLPAFGMPHLAVVCEVRHPSLAADCVMG
jgi:phosphopantothenoylcysteine synthetase/decarboxylase